MRIFAVDVGVGTLDALLYDSERIEENNVKLVLTSPTRALARRVRQAKGDLLFHGETMGGGPVTKAIIDHIEAGNRVLMTERASITVSDDLERVREFGIEVIAEGDMEKHDGERIEMKDVDFDLFKQFFEGIGEGFDFDALGIAVQDHGHEAGKSDRIFRFEKIAEALEGGASLPDFLYSSPPPYYTRMRAVMESAKRHFKGDIYLMDTGTAAIAGALHGIEERPAISIDVGNAHTLVALIGEERIIGMFEHHTKLLTPEKLVDQITRFADGKLTNKDIFEDGGHGCCIKDGVGIENVKRIRVTGPRRAMLENTSLDIELANPMGDVMMTGPVGIVDLIMG